MTSSLIESSPARLFWNFAAQRPEQLTNPVGVAAKPYKILLSF
jgi:hypothetical protein